MSTVTLEERGKALEDQFYEKENATKLATLKGSLDVQQTKDDLRKVSGMTDEAVRIFLARGVREATAPRFAGEHEEADMPTRWVPLSEAVKAVLAGRIHNPLAVMGVLAVGILVPAGPGLFGAFQAATFGALAMYFPSEVVMGKGSVYVFLLYSVQFVWHIVAAALAAALDPGMLRRGEQVIAGSTGQIEL